jgi:ABC-2 type transport system permease protein
VTALTGTWRLIWLALRRDRLLLSVWIVAISGLTASVIATVTALYADEAERQAGAAFTAASAMSRAFDGPASGTELGAMTMVEAYAVLVILVAIMSAQTVVRHTRQDEETGRAELLGSAVVGRHATLTAALAVAAGASVLIGVAVAGVLIGNDLAPSGAAVSAVAVAGVGMVFAGIAAVVSQIFATARAANAAAGAAVGLAFLLRVVGDVLGEVASSGVEVTSAWPSWLSPIGWGQQMRPFHQDNWGVTGLFAGLTLLLIAVAFWLALHRDIGTGMVAVRSGPAVASRGLRSPLGLAWRLQRTILIAWLLGLAVMGAAFGAIGDSADDFADISEQFERILEQMAPGGRIVDLFFTLLMGFIGVAVGAYTIQALLRMRAEEAAGRLEPLLAAAVDRGRWLAGHVTIAAAGTVAVLAISGLAGGLAYGAVTGQWADGLGGLLAAALAQAPAALALGGFVVAVFAVVPRWASSIAWAALAVSLVMGQLGALLELPQPVLDISPFTHVPRVPVEAFTFTPVAVLLTVAAVLGGIGFAVFRRRDLVISA